MGEDIYIYTQDSCNEAFFAHISSDRQHHLSMNIQELLSHIPQSRCMIISCSRFRLYLSGSYGYISLYLHQVPQCVLTSLRLEARCGEVDIKARLASHS